LSDSFSEFEVMIRLFITLPIGISSAVSVLRRIKNYLRSTMEQERTSDLALLAIDREAAEHYWMLVASTNSLLAARFEEEAD